MTESPATAILWSSATPPLEKNSPAEFVNCLYPLRGGVGRLEYLAFLPLVYNSALIVHELLRERQQCTGGGRLEEGGSIFVPMGKLLSLVNKGFPGVVYYGEEYLNPCKKSLTYSQ